MNALMLSLMYPQETLRETERCSKTGIQHQINSYQRAFVEGIDQNLLPGERLEIVNCLPVGAFPQAYRRLFLSGGLRDGRIHDLACVNLPWVKQKMRERLAARAILDWAGKSRDNRTLLLYTLYYPYLKAVARAKRKAPDLKVCAIVTDLPNQWGLASGRKGWLKKVEYRRGNEQIQACRDLDGFVLLTRAMKEVLPVDSKPCVVIEGLITQPGEETCKEESKASSRPAVLYSGTLNRELGVGELLAAFESMSDCELWLCGKGDMEKEILESAKLHEQIRYFGFVSHEEALRLQAQAALLINPRSPGGVFTRYSFPSKTLEYMRSGKPVLCYRLEGIPGEYDDYLLYIRQEGAQGISCAVKDALSLPAERLKNLGEKAKAFVAAEKNPHRQCQRLVELLRRLG